MRLLVPALLVACLAAGGCSGDREQDYCEAVEEHQAELSEVASSDDPGAVLEALDAYDDLADRAPRGIADDWSTVLRPLHRLDRALAEHDVDPSTYAAQDPPPGLSGDARAEIEAAARAVGSARTVEAMAEVEQHTLDVCGTPLSG
ncbi:hypothetical protein [Nocardioides sp. zg-1228]|uniref:hypothetical protein n=1 Tax=Nocardioides sp. zg-1228 TaxID=2763008 RepID=UPI00164234E4|nr:hypothetical protein [Nocardioides sp. zg-1228]MBC2934545.1 hypothetical protein [Nocardioides sp. zg-1228]QSF59300.1 hypothetical protein JX575_09170 [Nocardioides sp. zg-1228]